MPMTATQKENVATGYANSAAYVSFHTGDPGTTGANEVAGARAAITWTPGAVDGVITGTATGTVAAGTNIAYIGLWTAGVGGTFLDKAAGAVTSTGSVAVNLTATASG